MSNYFAGYQVFRDLDCMTRKSTVCATAPSFASQASYAFPLWLYGFTHYPVQLIGSAVLLWVKLAPNQLGPRQHHSPSPSTTTFLACVAPSLQTLGATTGAFTSQLCADY